MFSSGPSFTFLLGLPFARCCNLCFIHFNFGYNKERRSCGALSGRRWTFTGRVCRTIVLNRSAELAGSLERFCPLEKKQVDFGPLPFGGTVGDNRSTLFSNGWGQPFYTFFRPSLARPTCVFDGLRCEQRCLKRRAAPRRHFVRVGLLFGKAIRGEKVTVEFT